VSQIVILYNEVDRTVTGQSRLSTTFHHNLRTLHLWTLSSITKLNLNILATSSVDMTPSEQPNLLTSPPSDMAAPQLNNTAAPDTQPLSNGRPVVIGIYGIPGSGKTFLLNQLKLELKEDSEQFAFYEGSQVISSLVPGGLEAFQQLPEHDKTSYRQLAIATIGKECANTGRAAIVAGHFMFWPEGEEAGRAVYTQDDIDTYTHILYLGIPAEVITQRRLDDLERKRGSVSVEHLRKWQNEEKNQLRRLCMDHGILFSVVGSSRPSDAVTEVSGLVHDFRVRTEEYNLRRAEAILDQKFGHGLDKLETVLVVDGDRTLAAEDTGALFWKMAAKSRGSEEEGDPLKKLFSSPLGYSYTAFRQANLLYEEVDHDHDFYKLCDAVAAETTLYPEFLELLKQAKASDHVHAVIVTCGVAVIWERVLQRAGLDSIAVIGGGLIGDNGVVVTAEVKAALVIHLQNVHDCHVFAFGDSPLDLHMLSKSDQAIVVVGEKWTRSKTMEAELLDAIDNGGLRARQVLLPSNVSQRLDTTKLPLVNITDPEFIESVFRRRPRRPGPQVLHASSKNTAKLLMTPTRDATIAGPALREAHRRVGWYLATEFLTDLIGVEEYLIPHVQGHQTEGYRLAYEQQTLIVALMRGGEAMAFGVNDALPLAMFVHARQPEDILPHHVKKQHVVLLVDSVINNGKTAMQFIQRTRGLNPDVRIVVVAGVVQSQAVTGDRPLAQALVHEANLSVVALRLSNNKYTGRGTTDTGNRLFNTTHLP
jgi:uracil phosphoribosyltransferase/phosphoserine phosphatase/adenylate kinase